MNDKEKLKLLRSHRPDFLKILNGEVVHFQSEPAGIEMKFVVSSKFCHSKGTIVQGGFVTVMLDTPMAHLVIGLLEKQFNPLTLDINVSFLMSLRPGEVRSKAKVIKLGKTTGFLASELFQDTSLVATATSTVRLIPFK